MPDQFSISRINALGERLRKREPVPEDLALLDSYRRSFDDAYREVVDTILRLRFEPSGRIKTTLSIVEKLKRQGFRLSKLQDIAGCRIVVGGISDQDQAVSRISKAWPNAKIIDRRVKDSHGYRAVHIVIEMNGRFVEIQIRTELQHLWAVWSEALADRYGQALKYGAGPVEIQLSLTVQSAIFGALEVSEEVVQKVRRMMSEKSLPDEVVEAMDRHGDLKDLIRRKEEAKEQITREILKLSQEKKR